MAPKLSEEHGVTSQLHRFIPSGSTGVFIRLISPCDRQAAVQLGHLQEGDDTISSIGPLSGGREEGRKIVADINDVSQRLASKNKKETGF